MRLIYFQNNFTLSYIITVKYILLITFINFLIAKSTCFSQILGITLYCTKAHVYLPLSFCSLTGFLSPS